MAGLAYVMVFPFLFPSLLPARPSHYASKCWTKRAEHEREKEEKRAG